jgi:hypothetical protein
MAYGDQMSYLPALSRLMGEVEQTPGQGPQQAGMANPMFGGNPQQLMGILQNPQVQQQLQQLGIHFDPSQIKQSPFFSPGFSQAHPGLSGGITGAIMGAAGTPEAPLVSGAGSGISRAMQGVLGAPEMQRQYQTRQMMAPFQAAGAIIPAEQFAKSQQLLQLLQKMEQDRQNLAESAQDMQAQRDLQKRQSDINKLEVSKPYTDAAGRTWIPMPSQPGQPAGGPEGTNFQQQPSYISPGSRPLTSLTPGSAGQQLQMPAWGLTPATQATEPAWGLAPNQPSAADINAIHPDKVGTGALRTEQAGELGAERAAGRPGAVVGNINAQKGLREAQTGTEGAKKDELGARAERERAEAQQPGGRFGGAARDRYADKYNKAEQHAQDQISRVRQLMSLPPDKGGISAQEGQQEIERWNSWLATQKENIDREMGKPGQSAREAGTQQQKKTTDLPKTVNPNAQTSPNTIPTTPGLPPGYVLGDDGIPRKPSAPTAAPAGPQQ